MPTPEEIRKERLRIDLEELESIKGNVIQWTSKSGTPLVLNVTYNIRSIIDIDDAGRPSYRSSHKVVIKVPSSFPDHPPEARMAEGWDPIYHPNFFEGKGERICTQASRGWRPSESLTAFIVRIAKMIRFDPDVTNPSDTARGAAAKWYQSNLHQGWFPTDTVRLPLIDDPEDDSFAIVRQWN